MARYFSNLILLYSFGELSFLSVVVVYRGCLLPSRTWWWYRTPPFVRLRSCARNLGRIKRRKMCPSPVPHPRSQMSSKAFIKEMSTQITPIRCPWRLRRLNHRSKKVIVGCMDVHIIFFCLFLFDFYRIYHLHNRYVPTLTYLFFLVACMRLYYTFFL